jgi:hypothetical protein
MIDTPLLTPGNCPKSPHKMIWMPPNASDGLFRMLRIV